LNRGAQLTELLKQKQFVIYFIYLGSYGCWITSLCNIRWC
jgi:hypothetical protein